MRSMILTVLVFAVLLLQPHAASQSLVSSDDHYVLRFDEKNGVALTSFIDLAMVVLDRPIVCLREEVADVRIHIVGPVTVRHDDFDRLFLAVLRAYGFIVVDYGPEGRTELFVQRISGGGSRRRRIGCGTDLVPVESLHLYAQTGAFFITTSIPLHGMDASRAIEKLRPFYDFQVEQERAVAGSTRLVISGFGAHVWGAYQLLSHVDEPPQESRRADQGGVPPKRPMLLVIPSGPEPPTTLRQK
jgi:hypothetical protein